MGVSLGVVVFSAVKPIIKIYFIMGTGFFLAKRNILSVETTRNLSDIILTVLLPCLVFNKIVTNIEDSDIKSIGIIALSSILIFGIGGLCSLIVSYLLPVPKRWLGGILAGGIFPNISDLPIAYIQTLDSGIIFNQEQGEKGISHVIIFLTMFNLCLFNLGGFRLIEHDFKQSDDSEKREHEDQKENKLKLSNTTLRTVSTNQGDNNEELNALNFTIENTETDSDLDSNSDLDTLPDVTPPIAITQDVGSISTGHTRRNSVQSIRLRRSSLSSAISGTTTNSNESSVAASSIRSANRRISELRRLPSETIDDVIYQYHDSASEESLPGDSIRKIMTTDIGITSADIKKSGGKGFAKKYHLSLVVFFLKNCLRPCSLATIVALIIAFIPWVKALFVTTTVHVRGAPDQLPALDFIMNYTSYIGAASVPFALLLLGGAISRIQISTIPPGFWKASLCLVLLRLCIMPILGVLWVRALVAMSWVSKADVMLRFVTIISFGLPTMTSIIYFTAFLTKPDEDRLQMNCVSLYLLMQYPVLLISLPFLVTYTIKVELGY